MVESSHVAQRYFTFAQFTPTSLSRTWPRECLRESARRGPAIATELKFSRWHWRRLYLLGRHTTRNLGRANEGTNEWARWRIAGILFAGFADWQRGEDWRAVSPPSGGVERSGEASGVGIVENNASFVLRYEKLGNSTSRCKLGRQFFRKTASQRITLAS